MSVTAFNNYTRVNWKNGPSGGTPWSADNLNIMDAGIKTNNDMIKGLIGDVSELNNNILIRRYHFELLKAPYQGNTDYSFNSSVKIDGYSAIGIIQYDLEGHYSTWFTMTTQTVNNDIYNIHMRAAEYFKADGSNDILFIDVFILYKKN